MADALPNRIVFKCEFGGTNGWGHVVRCSALASEFLNHGWKPVLCSGGPASKLPAEVANAFTHVSSEALAAGKILFIDEMYTPQSTFEEWIKAWKSSNPGGLVAGIDDMQRRSMAEFDVVLNTELGLETAGYKAAHALLGERYALLRKGFSEEGARAELETGASGRLPVLVMIGGTDAYGLLNTVLSALYESKRDSLPIVVVGEQDLDCRALERFEESRVLRNLSSSELAAWLRVVRFGIIGCGTSVYELAALGVPFVGLSLVDNQEATARKIETKWGLPVVHCEKGRLEKAEVVAAVESLVEREAQVYSFVDTKGAKHVCDFLLKLVEA